MNKRPGLLAVLLLALVVFVSACGDTASAGSSANARLSLDRKEHARRNYPAWCSRPHLGNNARLGEI